MRGNRDQHAAEVDLDWKINEHNAIGLNNRFTLDGDSVGVNYALGITYQYTFTNLPYCGKCR